MAQKIFEIGQFMLGRTLQDSELRLPLAHYFITYLRTLQSEVLAQPGLANPDEIYAAITRRKPTDPITHVLVAIDALMNMTGTSSNSFNDILAVDPASIEQIMPPQEAQFLRFHDPYANADAFGDAVRLALPSAQKADAVDGGGTLVMRLLLVLRAVTPTIRAGILDKIPAPVLVMLRSRVVKGAQDELAKGLIAGIKAALDARSERGEQLMIPAANREGMAGAAAPPANPASLPGAPVAGHAAGAAGSYRPQARSAPAAAVPGAAAPVAPSRAAAAPAPAAAPTAEAVPAADALMDYRLLIAWRHEANQFKVLGLTPRELIGLAGPEPRLLLPWVLLALQTGQAFNFPAANVTKDLIEKLVKAILAKAAGLPPPQLDKAQVEQLVAEVKDLPSQKALLTLLVKGKLGDASRRPGKFAGALVSLQAKFGNSLGEFLRGPSNPEFRDLRVDLSDEEKQAVQVLQKLARLSAGA
jgi:hypothetical protein